MNIKLVEKKIFEEIEKAKSLKDIENVWRKYLSKKGEISTLFKEMKGLSQDMKKKTGKDINILKNRAEEKINKKKEKLSMSLPEDTKKIDITISGEKIKKGHIHPISQFIFQASEIFERMGFSVVCGPEVETESYNFDALNFPKNHPARDMHDTFWLNDKKENKERILMRTHTSPVQIRYMRTHLPPFRIIVPGRVFRHEATDASHEMQFYQLEGLMVGKSVSVANFRSIVKNFFQKFFKKEVKIRLRPGYFPFVEPGFEIDMSCFACGMKGCSMCKNTGWIEMAGAGMVHSNVFKSGGLNPKNWQGFAFGMGIDRLAMLKYKIDDIRLFYNGDLRFLNQF